MEQNVLQGIPEQSRSRLSDTARSAICESGRSLYSPPINFSDSSLAKSGPLGAEEPSGARSTKRGSGSQYEDDLAIPNQVNERRGDLHFAC